MHGERLVVDDLVQPAVRLVVDPHPPLFLHHLALVGERVLVDPERRHPVGFEPQHQRQVLRRHRLPEHRLVVGRVGVALAADRRDHRRVRLGLDVLRALEHQVLEEVREAGAARLLVLRADVIPELQVHDRRRVVLGQDHRQAVRQRGHLVLELRRAGRRRERRRRSAATSSAAARRPHRARTRHLRFMHPSDQLADHLLTQSEPGESPSCRAADRADRRRRRCSKPANSSRRRRRPRAGRRPRDARRSAARGRQSPRRRRSCLPEAPGDTCRRAG